MNALVIVEAQALLDARTDPNDQIAIEVVDEVERCQEQQNREPALDHAGDAS